MAGGTAKDLADTSQARNVYEQPVPRHMRQSYLSSDTDSDAPTQPLNAGGQRGVTNEPLFDSPNIHLNDSTSPSSKSGYAKARALPGQSSAKPQLPERVKPPLEAKPPLAAKPNIRIDHATHQYEYLENSNENGDEAYQVPTPLQAGVLPQSRPSRPVIPASYTAPAPASPPLVAPSQRAKRPKRSRMPRPMSLYDQLQVQSSDSDGETENPSSPRERAAAIDATSPAPPTRLFVRSPSRRKADKEIFVITKETINSEDNHLQNVCVSNKAAPKLRSPMVQRRQSMGKEGRTNQESANSGIDLGIVQLEKSGALRRQSGALKRWKSRWCILGNDKINFYKDQNAEELGRPPLNSIALDAYVVVLPTSGSDTDFSIETSQGTQNFAASSGSERKAWIAAISSRLSTLHVGISKAVMLSGWLTKVRNGHSKRRWCALMGRMLYYARDDMSKPIGAINVMDAMVQANVADSDNDEEEQATENLCFSVTTRRGIHYFLAENRKCLEKWTFYIHLASGKVPHESCTETERALNGLADTEAADMHVGLAADVLKFSKTPLGQPLTTLPSESIEQLAMALNGSVQMFTTVAIKTEAIAYHLKLAQDIVKQAMQEPAIYNEFYSQLIRQTHCHPYPNSTPAMQCWQLLVLVIPIFLPTAFFLTYLEVHLKRYAKNGGPASEIAIYGLESLEAAMRKGQRSKPPSVPEVLTVIERTSRHTTRHLLSIKIRLSTGSEYLVGFSPSSTCRDVCDAISTGLMMRPSRASGFALFTNDAGEPESPILHSLQQDVMLCDVLYDWEQTVQEKSVGRVDFFSMPRLYFRRRLYFEEHEVKDEIENILLAYQIGAEISSGRMKVNDEKVAIVMAATMAQLEWGNYDDLEDVQEKYKELLRFLPATKHILWNPDRGKNADPKVLFKMSEEKSALIQAISTHWRSLGETLAWTLGRGYVGVAKKLQFYGATIFHGFVHESAVSILVAVEAEGVAVLTEESFEPVDTIRYSDLHSFGTTTNKRSKTEKKNEKSTSTVQLIKKDGVEMKIQLKDPGAEVDFVMLMASYINVIVRRQGIQSPLNSIDHIGDCRAVLQASATTNIGKVGGNSLKI